LGPVALLLVPADVELAALDKSFIESLWLPATPGINYQLSVVIEIHKDAAGGGDGYLNAAVVDVGIS
jgi:hypothetical protein